MATLFGFCILISLREVVARIGQRFANRICLAGVGRAIRKGESDRLLPDFPNLGLVGPAGEGPLLPGAVLVTIPEVSAGGAKIGRALIGITGGLILVALFIATVAVLGTQVGWWGQPEMIRGILDLR